MCSEQVEPAVENRNVGIDISKTVELYTEMLVINVEFPFKSLFSIGSVYSDVVVSVVFILDILDFCIHVSLQIGETILCVAVETYVETDRTQVVDSKHQSEF